MTMKLIHQYESLEYVWHKSRQFNDIESFRTFIYQKLQEMGDGKETVLEAEIEIMRAVLHE